MEKVVGMKKKESLSEYTESEFLAFVRDIYECNGSEQEVDQWLDDFMVLVDHPEGCDLIFYPPDERNDSPEAIIVEIKRWYADQDLPCFKV